MKDLEKLARQVVSLQMAKAEIDAELKIIKLSGDYNRVLHELVDRAPGLISVSWRRVVACGIFE